MEQKYIIVAFPKKYGIPVYYYADHDASIVNWIPANKCDLRSIKRLTHGAAEDIINEVVMITSMPDHKIVKILSMVS